MAIITKPIGGILKGVPASISLSKSELAALSIIVADSYFSNTSNWNKVILKYRSSTGKQYEAVQFDATFSSPTGNFLVSIKARDVFEIQTIEIHDFDNDIFIVPRSALNVADFDVVLSLAPSSLSYSTPVTYTQNTAITNNVPTVTGTVTSYSILPALPAGLSLNTTTGIISGTPTEASAATNYVVTASNGAGSTTATISITVESAEVPEYSFDGRTDPNYITFPTPTSVTRLQPSINVTATGLANFWSTTPLISDFTFTATVKAGLSSETTVQAVFGLNDTLPPTGFAAKTTHWGIHFVNSPRWAYVYGADVVGAADYEEWATGGTYNIEIKRTSGTVSYKIGNKTFPQTLTTSATLYIVGCLQVGSWEVTNAQLVTPTSDYITWDLLTGYQAGSLTITPTSGVSGGISLAGNDVAVKSDADKATGDFDYTFKFDWSAATSVVDMFAGVTGNNVTAGTSPLFYDRLTCIYGNGNNPDTAYLWHNGLPVGGTTQTLLSGVNTYRLKRVGTTITHYLNDVQIYSAISNSFTAYPSVRTMGNSVVTESYITQAPISVTWNVAGKTGVGTVTTGANGLITKTTGGNGYNVNVLSNETITGDGYVEFINSSSFINVVFGLAEVNSPSGSYDQIIYGTYVAQLGTYERVEAGQALGNMGIGVVSGDVVRIQRTGTTFSILRNGSVMNTVTINNTNPLKASVSIYGETLGINNVTISE